MESALHNSERRTNHWEENFEFDEESLGYFRQAVEDYLRTGEQGHIGAITGIDIRAPEGTADEAIKQRCVLLLKQFFAAFEKLMEDYRDRGVKKATSPRGISRNSHIIFPGYEGLEIMKDSQKPCFAFMSFGVFIYPKWYIPNRYWKDFPPPIFVLPQVENLPREKPMDDPQLEVLSILTERAFVRGHVAEILLKKMGDFTKEDFK